MSDDEAEMARLRKKRGFASCFENSKEYPDNYEGDALLEKFVGRSYMNKMDGLVGRQKMLKEDEEDDEEKEQHGEHERVKVSEAIIKK